MSTPTPRTDEARRIDNGDTHPLLDEMEVMERELAIELERAAHYRDEWQKERAKVRVLRDACESICEEWGRNHDANPIGAGQKMETLASKALEKLEDAQ